MVFCSSCGNGPAAPGARFCASCGAALTASGGGGGGGGGKKASPVSKPVSKPSNKPHSPKPKSFAAPSAAPSQVKAHGQVASYKVAEAPKATFTKPTDTGNRGLPGPTYGTQPAWAYAEQEKNKSGQYQHGMWSQTGPKYK